MYHRGRHATKQETLHCCPSVPAKHDQVGIPFFGYAYNGFDNYVFQNRTFRSKTSSPQGLHGQVERPLCLTNFFLRDIQRNHLQDFHFRSLGPALSDEDRKSTRLNSSHGYISYAVFCLKKTNITVLDWTTFGHSLTLYNDRPLNPALASSIGSTPAGI